MVALVSALVCTVGERRLCANYASATALANGASAKNWGDAPKCSPYELDGSCPLLYVMVSPGGCAMTSAVGRLARRLLQTHGANTSGCAQELYKGEKNALLAHGDSLARSAERLALGFAESKRALWMKLPEGPFSRCAAEVPASRMRIFETYRANALDSIVCPIRDFNYSKYNGIRVYSNGTASDMSRRFSSSGAVERTMAKLDAKMLNKHLKKMEKENGKRATNQQTTNQFPAMTVIYTRLSNNMTAARVPAEMLLGFETKPHSKDRLDEAVAAWSAVLSSMGVAPNRARILSTLADGWGTRPPLTPHRDTIFNAAELKRGVEALGPEAAARINRFWRA